METTLKAFGNKLTRSICMLIGDFIIKCILIMEIIFYLGNPLPLVRMFMSAYTMFAFTTYSWPQTGANPSVTTENSGAPGKQRSIKGIKLQDHNFILEIG